MGVSHNVGDKLTYTIYCEDNHRVVSRSVICTVDPLNGVIINKQIDPDTLLDDSLYNDCDDPNCAKRSDLNQPDASLGEKTVNDQNDSNNAPYYFSGESLSHPNIQDSGETQDINKTGTYHKDTEEDHICNILSREPSGEVRTTKQLAPSKEKESSLTLSDIMQRRQLRHSSNKKRNQKLKLPLSGIRRSARPFGRMDKTTTRAMAKKQKAKTNALISGHDENGSKDKDKSSDPIALPKDGNNTVYKYKSNKPLSLRIR